MKKILFFGLFISLLATSAYSQYATLAYNQLAGLSYYYDYDNEKDNDTFDYLDFLKNSEFVQNKEFYSTLRNGSEDKYVKVMAENIRKVEEAIEVQQFLDLGSTFERIANTEAGKWLPYYYAGFSYTQAAFLAKDLNKIDEYADKGRICRAKADQISPGNSEVEIIEALNLLARIRVDFMQRGLQNSMTAIKTLKKAIELDPENPRAYAVLSNVMFNMPPQVGGSAEKGCQLNQQALQLIEKERTETNRSNIAPHWGYEAITETDKKCNPDKATEATTGDGAAVDYIPSMEAGINQFGAAKETQQYLDVASAFENIAKGADQEWLPYYYAAYSYIEAAFKTKEVNKIDEYADKGIANLEKAKALSPENPEIKVISALDLLCRIRADFIQRGMQNSMTAIKILNQVIKEDPENPRAYAVLSNVMFNMPPQVGGSEEKGCELNQKALQLIEKERAAAPSPNLEPHWGYESITETDQKICNK